ncbi:uncharacterized protein LOC142435706 [Tenrec ecaudatus]|uniref:uncharacterized protein LOC142434743 n=1 Tax=Tenrec ecaudatus TaxID=94439 RepID=UPI003F5AD92E
MHGQASAGMPRASSAGILTLAPAPVLHICTPGLASPGSQPVGEGVRARHTLSRVCLSLFFQSQPPAWLQGRSLPGRTRPTGQPCSWTPFQRVGEQTLRTSGARHVLVSHLPRVQRSDGGWEVGERAVHVSCAPDPALDGLRAHPGLVRGYAFGLQPSARSAVGSQQPPKEATRGSGLQSQNHTGVVASTLPRESAFPRQRQVLKVWTTRTPRQTCVGGSTLRAPPRGRTDARSSCNDTDAGGSQAGGCRVLWIQWPWTQLSAGVASTWLLQLQGSGCIVSGSPCGSSAGVSRREHPCSAPRELFLLSSEVIELRPDSQAGRPPPWRVQGDPGRRQEHRSEGVGLVSLVPRPRTVGKPRGLGREGPPGGDPSPLCPLCFHVLLRPPRPRPPPPRVLSASASPPVQLRLETRPPLLP